MRTQHFLLLLLTPFLLVAQPSFLAGPFDPAVPVPETILGYSLGERFTDYRLLENYILAVAGSSPRVSIIEYGASNELRPLRTVVITSPANHARLDEIRNANIRLTDPRSFSEPEAASIIKDLPAIVWFSFGVHGNESSSPEAALALLYQLAAGSDAHTRRLLDNIVLLIDPVLNPDGRERYVRWVNGTTQYPPNTDPAAFEHAEEWPGGRTNHYYFDLNRDWSWLTQKESRARVGLYLRWMPHTHVDFHEMSYESSYFFFPAAKPFHETLPPSVEEWGVLYGKGNARALDSIGSSYYVGERFDMFYPGYGDSWPTFNGGIGMTYEQAGGGQAGVGIRRSDRTTLRLIDRIRNHVTTGLATLETTVAHKKKRLEDFADYWRTSTRNVKGPASVIIPGSQDPSLLFRLADDLLTQGVEVHRLARPLRMPAKPFYGKRTEDIAFPEGTLIVSLSQPRGRLATALLEPKTSVKDTFFYDLSAWSIPVAFGLSAYQGFGELPKDAEKLESLVPPVGRVIGVEQPFAYLIPWDRQSAAVLTIRLLASDIRMRTAHKPFTIDGREFPRGTIVIPAAQNVTDIRAKLSEQAAMHGVDVYAVSSGWTEKGISLGSDFVRPIRLPSIGVLTGDGVSPNDYGELWYFFEQELRLPFSPLGANRLSRTDLDRYDVLVFPDGYEWKRLLDSSVVSSMKQWLAKGGILIALEEAARALASGFTPAVLAGQEKKDEKEKEKEQDDQTKARKELFKTLTSFEKDEYNRLNRIPGSIFRAMVDTTHPVGFGTDGELFVLKGNGIPFALSSEGHTIARFTPDTVQVSGYLPPGRGKQIANSAYIQEHRVGRGRVVLFSESMTFRMFWRGPAKLLVNSLLFLHEPKAE